MSANEGSYGTDVWYQSTMVSMANPGPQADFDQRITYEEIRSNEFDRRQLDQERRLRALEERVANMTASLI